MAKAQRRVVSDRDVRIFDDPPAPRKRQKYTYAYPRYTVTYRCETCGMRLSKAPREFAPLQTHVVNFSTWAYCPHCQRDMGTYQQIYQGMMFTDPDAEEATKVEKANSLWAAQKDPTADLTYAPPPFKPAVKKLVVLQLEHIRKNKPAQRWQMRGLINDAYRKARRALEELPKPKTRKDHIRYQYPRLVTTYLCDVCGFKTDHNTDNSYLPWCAHDGMTRLGTAASSGMKRNGSDPLQSDAALMRWVGVSYQGAALYARPASPPFVVESQMFGLKNVVRRPDPTIWDKERELDAWVTSSWDGWLSNIAAWRSEHAELLRASDDGQLKRQRPRVEPRDVEVAALREWWAAWSKRNAEALSGPHPPIEEIRKKLAPDTSSEPRQTCHTLQVLLAE